jgi:signal transduction histidine kinase
VLVANDGRRALELARERQPYLLVLDLMMPHVFDRFYRVDSSRSRETGGTGGTGLGLAIAQQLVETQGGETSIASTLGEGTAVTVRFPADAAGQ